MPRVLRLSASQCSQQAVQLHHSITQALLQEAARGTGGAGS